MGNILKPALWALSYFAPASPSPLEAHRSICQIIEQHVPDSVVYPLTASYNTSRSSYYTAQEEDLLPSCIFKPKHTADVSKFIRIITENLRRTDTHHFAKLKFAIRSGGHAVFAGAANIDGGITVDLREISSLLLSEDKSIAAIGAGSVWSDVYPQLVPHNLTVMGGRVAGVGVGGFLTGGGISHLSRRHGWACDNVVGYEVVLASGDIVYATSESHHDLWLALKGGSNNFGIVTRFDVLTRPLGQMWGGTLMFEYSDSQLAAQAAAFSDFMDPKNFDDVADMFVGVFFTNPGGNYLAGNVLYYGAHDADPKVYRPFTSLPNPIHKTLRVTNVSDLSSEQASVLPPDAKRSINLVYSFRNAPASVYRELFQTWEDGSKELADVEGLQLALLIQPHPVSDGVNSLGLEAGGEDVVMSALTVAWSHKKDDEVVRRSVTGIIKKHEQILEEQEVYIPWKYLNYADYTQDPIGSYGEGIHSRLRFASLKYDPYGVFQRNVPGGFKLFKP